jgi:hypothetical protein
MARCEELRKANEEAYKSAPVLLLVTGDRAEFLSYSSLALKRRATFRYDTSNLEASAGSAACASFTELSRGYLAMSIHCTVACYERGPQSKWEFSNVIPVLSDWMIIPRVACSKQFEVLLRTYAKGAKKCLADSRFLAGGQRFREANLSEIVPSPMPSPTDNEDQKQ